MHTYDAASDSQENDNGNNNNPHACPLLRRVRCRAECDAIGIPTTLALDPKLADPSCNVGPE